MPNIKSAKKRVVVNEKKNLENRMVKSTVKTAIRKYNDALASGDVAAAEKLLPETVSVIDSAVSKGILHKNNAANKKIRFGKEPQRFESEGVNVQKRLSEGVVGRLCLFVM